MAAAFDAGDLRCARRLQATARALVRVADRHGGLAALQAVAGTRGPDLGPCRLPLRTPDERRRKLLADELEHEGVLDALDGGAPSPG